MSAAPAPHELVELALQRSAADGCIVLVTVTYRADLRWARTTLTTNGESVTTSMTVISTVATATGTAVGAVSRSGIGAEDVAAVVAESEAIAREAEDAEDAAPLVGDVPSSLDWTAPATPTSGAVFTAVAQGLGDVFAAAAADGIEHFGYAEHSVDTTWLGTSTGLRLRFAQPEGRLELTAKSHGRTRSTWAGVATNDFSDVDLAGLDAQLRQGLSRQARTVSVDPGRHDALLTPSAVADLMVDLWWSSAGREAAEGRSVFSRPGGGTRIGERLSDRDVTLLSDPAYEGLRCSPFATVGMSSSHASVFDNGLPLPPVEWLRDGTLTALATSRATARETGLPLSPSADNLVMTVGGGAGDVDALAARCGRGLLVTCLWYNRLVDPQTLLLTGLTRDGVYLVEGGEVVGSVGNFRFNDSPVDLLSRIADAGSTERTLPREMGDYANRVSVPPLLVRDFNFSTRSDAL